MSKTLEVCKTLSVSQALVTSRCLNRDGERSKTTGSRTMIQSVGK